MSVNRNERNRRALIILAVTLAIGAYFEYGMSTGVPTAEVASADPEAARQQLARLRQIAATAPSREALMKQISADLADRERGVIQADTAAQAQAALLETASRLGKAEQLDVRGGDFSAPKPFGTAYGLVYATVTFDCHIEQLVNFLADLAKEPQLIVPSEQRITAVSGGAGAKEKLMSVRMVLAGVVPRRLVPEKKGLAAF